MKWILVAIAVFLMAALNVPSFNAPQFALFCVGVCMLMWGMIFGEFKKEK